MEDARSKRRFARNVWIAWGLWMLSLFLPALVFRGIAPGGGSIAIAGWRTALICVLEPSGAVDRMMKFRGFVSVLVRMMGLTNLVMATSLVTLVTGRFRTRIAFRGLAFGGAAINLLALVWYSEELSIAYVVWLASFITLGIALSREPAARRPF
jgi:hypothetical protein